MIGRPIKCTCVWVTVKGTETMRKRILLAGAGSVILALGCAAVWSAVQVQADKDNVVASRLAGRWKLDAPLTRRLTGVESPDAWISFTGEAAVAAKIPAKYDGFLGKKQIYMAGIMAMGTREAREYPFVLTEHKGNPHVVYFRERGGEAMGDAESFNVMLAVAKDPQNDLLFIGGDFNNQPFKAYGRVKGD